MAKWRAIYKKISKSGQVNRMSEFAQFLFERAMLHTDDWGVITGDPLEVKASAIPLSPRSEEEFESALEEMEAVGLIWRYEPDGWGPLIQFINFDDHQPQVLIGNRSDPKQPLHYLHESYGDYPALQWITLEEMEKLENPGNSSESLESAKDYSHSKSRSKSVSKKGSERDSRLDHPAIKGYRHLARLHIPIPLRDDWIACGEEIGVEKLLKFTKEWIGNGWNKQNVNGIMDYARKDGKGATHKRGKRTDTQAEDLPYNDWLAEREAAEA